MQKAAMLRKQAVQQCREQYREESRKRLGIIIKTKLQTSFIGAIDRFEKYFGFLWGHGKPKSALTPTETEFRRLWFEARKEVLDNGHAQLRALVEELRLYSVAWNGYRTTLLIKPTQDPGTP